jgi:hypothetical protein
MAFFATQKNRTISNIEDSTLFLVSLQFFFLKAFLEVADVLFARNFYGFRALMFTIVNINSVGFKMRRAQDFRPPPFPPLSPDSSSSFAAQSGKPNEDVAAVFHKYAKSTMQNDVMLVKALKTFGIPSTPMTITVRSLAANLSLHPF